MNKTLSVEAAEFVPKGIISCKPKKSKDERSCPRKRRKAKPQDDISSISSNHDSHHSYPIIMDRSYELQEKFNTLSIEDENHVLENLVQSFLRADGSEEYHHILSSSSDDVMAEAFLEVEWLHMQHKWRTTKQMMVFSDEIESEISERRKWSQWAIHAAEIERQRRIKVLRDLDDQNDEERKARAKWAIDAIELERHERVYHQFLMSLTSTNWFNETISSTMEDYELVCPYYKLGCMITCRRSTLAKHLQDCQYALDIYPPSNHRMIEDYEVVCPNSVLGCTYTGGRSEVMAHLQSCTYSHGQSKEDEYQERLQIKNSVILECEVERSRRVSVSVPLGGDTTMHYDKKENDDDSSVQSLAYGHPAGVLHNLLRSQMTEVLGQLHDDIISLSDTLSHHQIIAQQDMNIIISSLQKYITQLWPFASVEVYGSYHTGLHGPYSDLDLVISFSDEYESLSKTSGSFPLLHVLADYLQREAQDMLIIDNVILTARIPVIKATCTSILNLSSIAIDISIDAPMHSGIATASMVQTLVEHLPPLKPIVIILKEYLRSNGLTGGYHGGISSYGLTLLCLIPILKRHHQQQHQHQKMVSPVTSHDNLHELNRILSKHIPKLSLSSTSSDAQHYHQLLHPTSLPDSATTTPRLEDMPSSTMHVTSSSSNMTRQPLLASTNLIRNRSTGSNINHNKPSSNHSNNRNARHVSSPSTEVSLPSSPTRHHGNRSRHNSWNSEISSSASTSASVTTIRTSGFHWTNISRQKEYGRQVAWKLLAYHPTISDEMDITTTRSISSQHEHYHTNAINISRSASLSLLSLDKPILGEILEEILHEYGEEMQIGVHGFSVRNGGFRFDVNSSNSSCSHPHASDPIVIEDPVDVIHNVGAGCYKAIAIQRLFLDAHDRFKSFAVRFNSPRVGMNINPQLPSFTSLTSAIPTTTSAAATTTAVPTTALSASISAMISGTGSSVNSNPGSNRCSRRLVNPIESSINDMNNNTGVNILQEIFGADYFALQTNKDGVMKLKV